MILTAEISMYPLADDYLTPIRWFISELEKAPNIKRRTTATSTTIQGEYDEVMQVLNCCMKQSHEKFGQASFVVKFLKGELDMDYQDEFCG
ncbi:YkoF family thiamine/hydroxymethylpyrimidine-binding protein [Paraferrimonas sp. SM1919]|uniref:YkoF family thiamine/hydroxymethylpyrimidine-binding protein n=1 Tax=Paraferrimonas sp. SM1919 TaxID=2662263 RepID=UPI0013D5F0AF|nr:YkoF family thiamine/hydroxymethylpyrimidine-binding protein [Paraferrimonas sp. SM1919]